MCVCAVATLEAPEGSLSEYATMSVQWQMQHKVGSRWVEVGVGSWHSNLSWEALLHHEAPRVHLVRVLQAVEQPCCPLTAAAQLRPLSTTHSTAFCLQHRKNHLTAVGVSDKQNTQHKNMLWETLW